MRTAVLSRLIASEDQHCKCVRCVGLAYAQDVIFGISNCKYCKNFTLKTLDFWPRICRSSSRRGSGGLLPLWSHGLEFGGGARGHGEWAVFTFSPSIAWASPHKFSGPVFSRLSCTQPWGHGTPFPSVWRIFYIPLASDSEDFGAASLDVLPPSGQEALPSPAYTELVDVLARVTEKQSLD